MRVPHSPGLVGGLRVLAVVAEPVIGRPVAEQEILRPTVVEDDVLDYLDATLVGLADKAAIVLIGSESGIGLIIIGNGIAVISLPLHVVYQCGSGPYGRDAQFLQVVEMGNHALEVAPMACHILLSPTVLLHAGIHLLLLCIGGSRSKAVGHEQIHHITGIKALHLADTALPELVWQSLHHLLAILEQNAELLRLRILGVKVKNDVVLVGHIHHFIDADAVGILELGHQFIKARAMDKHLQPGILHACPPKGRMHLTDLTFLFLACHDRHPREQIEKPQCEQDFFQIPCIHVLLLMYSR